MRREFGTYEEALFVVEYIRALYIRAAVSLEKTYKSPDQPVYFINYYPIDDPVNYTLSSEQDLQNLDGLKPKSWDRDIRQSIDKRINEVFTVKDVDTLAFIVVDEYIKTMPYYMFSTAKKDYRLYYYHVCAILHKMLAKAKSDKNST